MISYIPLFRVIFRISCLSRQLTGKWGRILNLANFKRKALKYTAAATHMMNSKRSLPNQLLCERGPGEKITIKLKATFAS